MPRLLRLYITSILVGLALAICFTLLLVALDVAHLRHLIIHSSGGAIAVVMLVTFHTILFGGVQFGYAVMLLADKGAGPTGGKRQVTPKPAPVRHADTPSPRPQLWVPQANRLERGFSTTLS